jgi:DNA polymerase/3'-5' exonuclease PolX
MKLQQAETISKNFLSEIKEFCERIEIAGSIRRRKPEVNDIDIVLIPRQREHLIQRIRKISRVDLSQKQHLYIYLSL